MDQRHPGPSSTEPTHTADATRPRAVMPRVRSSDFGGGSGGPTTRPGWEGKRPTLWRLPLVAFLATGLVCLNYLDGRLSSDYRKSAADLSVQTDAQIESAVSASASAMHELQLLMAHAPSPAEQRARFATFAGTFADARPEVMRVYRLDVRGVVRDFVPDDTTAGADLTSENHLLIAETAA